MTSASAAPHPPLGVAVVGYGYWGPNLVRNVIERPEFELARLCERDADARGGVPPARTRRRRCSADLDDVLADAARRRGHRRDAAARRTTRSSKAALEAGKHVLVEKPLATTAAEARDLDRVRRRTATSC